MLRTILIFFLIFSVAKVFASGLSGNKQLTSLIEIAKENNPQIKKARHAVLAAKHKVTGANYYPDPMMSFNLFGSPIETKNGSQTSNFMLSQQIPWPRALTALEHQAESIAALEQSKASLLILTISYQLKTLVFNDITLHQKIQHKKRMRNSLRDLIGVVLARLKVGQSNQAEISRINIEIAKLTQDIRLLETKVQTTRHHLHQLLGVPVNPDLLPTQMSEEWLFLPANFSIQNNSFEVHPKTQINSHMIEKITANLEFERTQRLPKMTLSATWFQIEKSKNMASSENGKDAWAVGAAFTIPIWSGKYNASEHSLIAERAATEEEQDNTVLELKTKLASLYDEFLSTQDIVKIFKNDILPQADQSLLVNQKAYQQGSIPFDRVIDDYLRLIKFEDQLVDNLAKLANLKAEIEHTLDKTI